MPTHRPEGRLDTIRQSFDVEEFRRRNLGAVVMDALYLFTTSFFVVLALKGAWPAAVAAVPLGTLLYFGGRSSPAFFVAQLLTIAGTALASNAGLIPL